MTGEFAPLPVPWKTHEDPDPWARIGTGKPITTSELVKSALTGVEDLERVLKRYRSYLDEIRTLLVARGYDVADLPPFLLPLALASIVPERPKKEVSRD